MANQREMSLLRADLAAVEALLSDRSQDEDPVGYLQLSLRKSELEEKLQHFIPSGEHHARIALFFGGSPVIPSQGIRANFACQAVMQFQDIVIKRFASLQAGPLPLRGPVPFRENAHLMITDVARGSFGFVLEEEVEDNCAPSHSLEQAMHDTSDLIYRISSPEEGIFETLSDDLDERVLAAVKRFFQTMDEGGATLKIVHGDKKIPFSSDAIRRGKTRTSDLEIAEKEEETRSGKFFVLPGSRKFELYLEDGEILRGGVASDFLKKLHSDEAVSQKAGTNCTVRMRVREFVQRNSVVQTKYTLIGIED